jgi:2-iminobutanoate/2-iminopropanoate deaminase
MKRAISTDQAPSAPHILSQAIISNGLIFVAGQVHVLPDNSLVGETTEEKTHQVMKNIKTILEAADADMDDIVRVTIYVTDMTIMPDLNKVYPTYFTEPLPVREAVCVNALPLNANIEISVIALQK